MADKYTTIGFEKDGHSEECIIVDGWLDPQDALVRAKELATEQGIVYGAMPVCYFSIDDDNAIFTFVYDPVTFPEHAIEN
ncbi:hypothetical protein LPJ61_006984, partial [Coemansia biformis]